MKNYPHLKWPEIIRNLIDQQLQGFESSSYRQYSLAKLRALEGAEELFEF